MHLRSATQTAQTALDWSDLELILAICRARSLSGAARALGKTHSTVFRNINAIEARTGVRFFDRMAQGYAMTDAGRTAMAYAERMENEVHAFGREILGQDGKLRGRIRVTTPESFAEELAPAMIARFLQHHPDIQIDLIPAHGALDLNRREAEVAIRATRQPPETAFGRRIGNFRFALYAAESYLAATPDQPLAERRFCLIEGAVAMLVPAIWKTREEAEDRAVFQCRASRAVLNAAAEGMGVAFLPCYVGDTDPRLVRASDTLAHLDMELWVLTHRDLRQTARVRALIAFLGGELQQVGTLFDGTLKSPDRWNLFPRRE